jgi:hypothetical protein
MVLDASTQPTFVDPQAAVCWSTNLAPSIKNDFHEARALDALDVPVQ